MLLSLPRIAVDAGRLDIEVGRRRAAARLLLLALSFFSLPVVAGAADGDPRAIPLVDQRGATFRLMDLAGEPAVLTFVAARCTDACPIANAVFARMARQLRRDRFDARLVTVTLDPAHDTPAVMARLARSFAARTTAWRFASGRPADIRRLMDSLGVDVEPDAHGIPDSHTTFVYVLDRDVRLKRTLLLTAALARDVEDVLRKPAALSAR